MKQATLTPLERLSASLMRRYPLASGCGTLATTKLANWLVPPRAETTIGYVRGRKCLAPLDDLVGRAIVLVGDLDPKVSWVIDNYVRPGDTLLDVGANLGLVTLLLGAKAGPTSKIYMFEPGIAMLDLLDQTIAMNGDLDLTLFRFAVGRTEEKLTLAIPFENAGRASLVRGSVHQQKDSYEVDVKPLAGVLKEQGVDHIDLMKIDIEGFEGEAFAGLFGDPDAPRPKVILFEENHTEGSALFADLQGWGYRVFGLPLRYFRPELVPMGHDEFASCHDFVAVHASADADRIAALGLRDLKT